MEAFEHVVKCFLEERGYIVTSGVKFPIKRRTRKMEWVEEQTHGYEVDIVAAKSGSLILGSVKSFFGSSGVRCQGFRGLADETRQTHYPRYVMFNEEAVRTGIISGAHERFGFPLNQIELALFVGKFHKADESAVRNHLGSIHAGAGPIKVYGLPEIAKTLIELASRKTYINDPVIVTLKVLKEAGLLVI